MINKESIKMEKFNSIYNSLIERGHFTEAELRLVTDMYGSNVETLNKAIYARFGVHDYEQLMEED